MNTATVAPIASQSTSNAAIALQNRFATAPNVAAVATPSVAPKKLPVHYRRFQAVLDTNDNAQIEAFARDEQAKRDAAAECSWWAYRLSGTHGDVITPEGKRYLCTRAMQDAGQSRFTCKDQEFCDWVNQELRARFGQCFLFRLTTKHYLIGVRLMEIERAKFRQARGW